MDEHAWQELSAALMHRMRWSWRDLQETPLAVVEAVLDRLAREQQQGSGNGANGAPAAEGSVELG